VNTFKEDYITLVQTIEDISRYVLPFIFTLFVAGYFIVCCWIHAV